MRIALEHRASTALSEKLQAADDMTPELMTEILDVTRRRVLLERHSAKILRLNQLLDIRAWTDAALALLELERPLWQIRRIAYDAGEWPRNANFRIGSIIRLRAGTPIFL